MTRHRPFHYLCFVLLFSWPAWAQAPRTVYGVDTAARVTLDAASQATNMLGQVPSFWGRYFEGPYQFNPTQESAIFHQYHIRLLPVGDDTHRVGADRTRGLADGQRQARAYINLLGEDHLASQGGEFYIFLDVELGTGESVLSPAYYQGWSEGVETYSAKVKLLPGVYMSAANTASSHALTQALKKGAKCYGLWIAHDLHYNVAADKLPLHPPAWNAKGYATPKQPPSCYPSDPKALSFDGRHCPVIFWQFNGNIRNGANVYDWNMLNPHLNAQAILKRLAQPTGSTASARSATGPSASAGASCPNHMPLYTVKSGQTLADIARQECGQGALWTRITDLSGKQFTASSAVQLEAGERICLPAACH